MASRVIVITGANGGLGRALAQRFASEGEQVVLLGRSLGKVQAVADAIGAGALAVECDVTSPNSVRAAFATIAETHPRIDALINNAAIFKPFLVEEASDEQVLGTVLTNLAGPILCARAAIPMLNRNGHIINLSSDSIDDAYPHLTVYQATKAGLETFGIHLQRELADQGIRVTTVRAGQMVGDTVPDMDPVAMGRLFAEAAKRGVNLMAHGVSQYHSTTSIFRNLLDLPPDVHVGTVRFQSRVPD
jgi:meso-butanediol dehydrogenase/(S,S)-butanediol dehydrogenase/diacetyl reductase